ncbi:phage tail tape measure protein [Brevibacillus choshinensis]|uniref:phage tail tape measure protein n=1 Tax=Brevibacillus choshinensis TaxID=54911 RepID=UPI002E1AE9F2|nr:phage tail tape measure protein [Brevibacillus choshinensis]
MAETIRGINVVIGAETTGLSKALTDVNTKSKSIQSELKQVEKLLKLDPTNTELVAQKQKLLADAVSNTREKLDRLKAAQEQVNRQFAEGKISEGQFRAFQREVVSAEQELKRFDEQLEQVNKTTDSMGDRLKNAGEKMSGVGQTMAGAITAPILAVGGALLKVTSDAEAAQSKLQASLGITAEEAQELGEIARSVWKDGFGADLEEVNQALVDVRQNMSGLANEELAEVTEGALSIAEIFGQDVKEITAAAGVMMKNFGISGKDALDIITTGFQQGGDFSGELLDTLREYAPQFNALGISADNALGMLIKGAQTGAFNLDKVGDAFKEFNIRIKDGSDLTYESMAQLFAPDNIEEFTTALMKGGKDSQEYLQLLGKVSADTANQLIADLQKGGNNANDAFIALQSIMGDGVKIIDDLSSGSITGYEAMQKIIGKLSEIEDPITKAQLGVALFGTQWEDLEADVITAMTSGENSIGDFIGATDKATKTLIENNPGKALQAAFRSLQDALKPTLVPIVNMLTNDIIPAVKGLAEVFASLPGPVQTFIIALTGFLAVLGPILMMVAQLIPLFTGIATVVGTISAAVAGAGGMMAIFGTALAALTGPIGIVIAAIAALAVAAYLIYDNWEPIKAFFIELWESIKTVTEAAWEGIKQLFSTTWDWIKSFFTEWGPVILAIIAPFIGIPLLIQQHWDEILPYLTALWQSVKQVASNAWNLIVSTVLAIVTPFVDGVMAIFNSMQAGLTMIWEGIKMYFGGVWNAIKSIFLGAVLLIYDLVTGNFTQLSADAQLIWMNLQAAFGQIWEGIKLVFSGALEAVKGYLTLAWTTIQTLTQSVWNGILQFLSFTWESMKSLNSLAMSTIKTTIVTVWNAIKAFFSETWEKIKWLFTAGLSNAKATVVSGMTQIKSDFISYMNDTVNEIKEFAEDFVEAGEDFVISLWDGIKSKTSWLWKQIKGWIDGLISQIRGALSGGSGGGGGNDTGDSSMSGAGGGGGASAASFSAPGLKDGGTVTRSGWTWVGENGPELLGLPQASQVIPNYDIPKIGGQEIDYDRLAKAIAVNSKPNVTMNNTFNSPTPLSPAETARKNLQVSRQLAMEWGM